MESIWKKDVPFVHFEALKGNKNTDVLIICGGITKNTTAKITLSHGLIYDKMIKRYGKEKAMLYAKAQISALKEYTHLYQPW